MRVVWQRSRAQHVSKFLELLPYWFYFAGSACFLIGSLIVIWRAYS